MRLASPEPEVRLVAAFDRPFDGAVAAARTCYASQGIVTVEQVAGDLAEDPAQRRQAIERRDALATDIYRAGHHTVFQHAHFSFTIDRVSRHALWAFFHAHPFYNSEQVSQRYVKVRPDTFLVPSLPPEQKALYTGALEHAQEAYRALREKLEPVAAAAFFDVFPARGRQPRRWRKEIRRLAQEAARYVLPVATWARLYHTISALTLLRYRRAARQSEIPAEVGMIVERMVAAVVRWDPNYEKILEPALETSPLPAHLSGDTAELNDPRRAAAFRAEFDADLGNRASRLVGYSADAEGVVARAVREVLGRSRADLSDEAALELVADPAANPVLGETLNLTTLAPLSRCLHHAHYTFRKRLSHSADSQDQRHRMTPGSRPLLLAHLGEEPDVTCPSLIAGEPSCRTLFDEAMARTWQAIGRLRRSGAPTQALAYLLPNAVNVRFTESGDYLALRHKHAMRLCYNAQEEIWRASRDEALQVREVHPVLGRFLLPPCSIRDRCGQRPVCPEGKRYCGVRVWTQDVAEYDRSI
ncbi:MAG: FAD-dependent thymidylate synthase [Acidobacteriota bacterium]|nr:FAD-dependent thymidylate synthase [Acidobacteriota bacterium]